MPVLTKLASVLVAVGALAYAPAVLAQAGGTEVPKDAQTGTSDSGGKTSEGSMTKGGAMKKDDAMTKGDTMNKSNAMKK